MRGKVTWRSFQPRDEFCYFKGLSGEHLEGAKSRKGLVEGSSQGNLDFLLKASEPAVDSFENTRHDGTSELENLTCTL